MFSTSCVHMGSTTHWKFGNMARVAHCVEHLKTVQPVLVFGADSEHKPVFLVLFSFGVGNFLFLLSNGGFCPLEPVDYSRNLRTRI